MADPVKCHGQYFTGTFKSYSAPKGYGFINSDDLLGDIFIVHKNLPRHVVNAVHGGLNLVGESVSFTIEVSEEGKPVAVGCEVHMDIPYDSGKGWGKGGDKGWGKGGGDKGWGKGGGDKGWGKGGGGKGWGKGKNSWGDDGGFGNKWGEDQGGYGYSKGGKGKGMAKGKGKGPYW